MDFLQFEVEDVQYRALEGGLVLCALRTDVVQLQHTQIIRPIGEIYGHIIFVLLLY